MSSQPSLREHGLHHHTLGGAWLNFLSVTLSTRPSKIDLLKPIWKKGQTLLLERYINVLLCYLLVTFQTWTHLWTNIITTTNAVAVNPCQCSLYWAFEIVVKGLLIIILSKRFNSFLIFLNRQQMILYPTTRLPLLFHMCHWLQNDEDHYPVKGANLLREESRLVSFFDLKTLFQIFVRWLSNLI